MTLELKLSQQLFSDYDFKKAQSLNTISDLVLFLEIGIGSRISDPGFLALQIAFCSVLQKGGPFGTILLDSDDNLLGFGANHVTRLFDFCNNRVLLSI